MTLIEYVNAHPWWTLVWLLAPCSAGLLGARMVAVSLRLKYGEKCGRCGWWTDARNR